MRLLLITLLCLSFVSCYSQKGSKNGTDITDDIKNGKDIVISNKTFENDIDLTTILAGNPEAQDIFRSNITSSITFDNCIFNGKITAYRQEGISKYFISFARNLTFNKCTFNQEINFRGIAVYGLVDINGSMFNKKVVFEEAKFFNDAHFAKCFFMDEARFQNCYFTMRADFMNSLFDKVCSFQGTHFNHEAQFGVTKYKAYADFTLTQYNAGVFFNYAEFSKQAVFDNSKFGYRAEFLSTSMTSGSFRNCTFFGDTKFSESKVKEKLDLGRSVFYYGAPKLDGIEPSLVKKEGAQFTTLNDLK
jgi:hypothetical protein